MRLTVVGCSPAWPNPGSAHSGYLVEGAGTLLLDCGPGVLARLDPGAAIDAIALTHFHLDHCGDLVPWVWRTQHLEQRGRSQPRPVLHVPPGGREWLGRFGGLFGRLEMFERTFWISEYEAGVPFEAAGYSVVAARVPHYDAQAYALRVEAGGRTLAFSGDSAPTDELTHIARDADLFLCEATLDIGDDDGSDRGHLGLDEAIAISEQAGAKRLLVTHRPADLPAPEQHELARDGLVVDV